MDIKFCFVFLVVFNGVFVLGEKAQFEDVNFVISLAKYFNAREIIVVQKEDEINPRNIFQFLKCLLYFGNNIYASVVTPKDVLEILKRRQFVRSKILAVLPTEDFSPYESFIQQSQNFDFSPLIWTILTSQPNITIPENIQVPFDRQFTISRSNGFSGYEITEIYSAGSKRFQNHFGEWNVDKGLIAPRLDIFSRRKNFMGSEIRISSIGYKSCVEPYFLLDVREIVKCVHIQAWSIISEALNLTIVHPDDKDPKLTFLERAKNFGIESSYENWALKVQITEDYSFLWPSWKTHLEIYTAYQGQAFEWRTFIRPYDTKVWAAVVASILVSTGVMIFVRFLKIFPEDAEMANSDYFLLPYFAFCNQGVPDTPKGFNYRALFLLSFLVPTVMVPAYSAVLTSFLTVHFPQMPFTDIDGLAASKLYKFGSVKDFHIVAFLKKDPSPAAQKLLTSKLVSPLPPTIKHGISKMCKEKFSFLNIAVSMNSDKVPCRFFKLDRPFLIDYFGMPFRKNSPYKTIVNRVFRNMAFTGVFEALKDRVTSYAYKIKNEREVDEEVPITLENIVVLFTLVLLGALASFLVFLIELVCWRKFSRKKGLKCGKLIMIKFLK